MLSTALAHFHVILRADIWRRASGQSTLHAATVCRRKTRRQAGAALKVKNIERLSTDSGSEAFHLREFLEAPVARQASPFGMYASDMVPRLLAKVRRRRANAAANRQARFQTCV